MQRGAAWRLLLAPQAATQAPMLEASLMAAAAKRGRSDSPTLPASSVKLHKNGSDAHAPSFSGSDDEIAPSNSPQPAMQPATKRQRASGGPAADAPAPTLRAAASKQAPQPRRKVLPAAFSRRHLMKRFEETRRDTALALRRNAFGIRLRTVSTGGKHICGTQMPCSSLRAFHCCFFCEWIIRLCTARLQEGRQKSQTRVTRTMELTCAAYPLVAWRAHPQPNNCKLASHPAISMAVL